MAFVSFSDEQARTIVNVAQSYQSWIEAERRLHALPYDLKIREINGARYLYETVDRQGNGKSCCHGKRQRQHDAFLGQVRHGGHQVFPSQPVWAASAAGRRRLPNTAAAALLFHARKNLA